MRWLFPLLLVAFFVRLYHFAFPLGDLHSWRQADTAAVARSLYAYGPSFWLPVCQTEGRHIAASGEQCRIPLLNPQIDSFVTIDGKATWMDGKQHTNDTRNHFAEFPLYQAVVAQTAFVFEAAPFVPQFFIQLSRIVDATAIYIDPPPNVDRQKEVEYQAMQGNALPIDTIILSGRFVSIFASLGVIVMVFLLCNLYFRRRVGYLAAAVCAFLPYFVFWSRSVLPDMMMLFFCLSGLYCLHRALAVHQSRRTIALWSILTILSFACALLLKFFVLFLLIPISYLIYVTYRKSLMRNWYIPVALVLVVVPFLLWRIWIQSDPARLPGIPASNWLFNGSGVRLKPAWWYWLFQTRLDHFMFNFSGLVPAFIGGLFYSSSRYTFFLHEAKQRSYFWPLTLLSLLLFLIVFATGNVQHEYYQLPLVPFIAVFLSLGFWYVWSLTSGWGGWIQKGIIVGLVGLMLLLGSYKVKDWYGPIVPSYVYAGVRADNVLPKDAVVVADFGGDTTMLYYVNRPGWSIVEFSFEELVAKGATHYVSAFRSDAVNEMANTYRVIEETPEYVILDIKP